ncbi:MAG: protein-L-isoaspartate(D-aspartate) O-methyltransferase [Gammaproteobacteria bacterium]
MSKVHQGIGMTSQRSRNRLVEQLREMGIRSEAVLEAIRNTPRHIFVDEALSSRAYDNTALPIGYNQTISQPYIVARMTEALFDGYQPEKVLEIGTGCGYQSIILSYFANRVYTVERISALLNKARERFYTLKCRNIHARYADGTLGWPEFAPFDGIIVTAAPAEIPQGLIDQLSLGGRLIIPVGRQGEQSLLQITRTPEGIEQKQIDSVSFVPMLGGMG